jgi:outer membrane lipoprotein carrier protein
MRKRDVFHAVVGTLLLAMLANGVAAAKKPAGDSLHRFFSQVQNYTAQFNQVVLDEALNTIQESSGTLWIERPNRFRWDYDVPFKQQIVADGKKIWVYDQELQQVTVRALTGGLGDTPAVLLAGRGKLDDNFTVKRIGVQGDLEWMQLQPKRKDGGFEDIRIGFEQGRIRILEMVDGFGNTTRVTLRAGKENTKIDTAMFDFKAPKGVDVIGDQ